MLVRLVCRCRCRCWASCEIVGGEGATIEADLLSHQRRCRGRCCMPSVSRAPPALPRLTTLLCEPVLAFLVIAVLLSPLLPIPPALFSLYTFSCFARVEGSPSRRLVRFRVRADYRRCSHVFFFGNTSPV